jgi:hypothetical protein
LVDNARHILFHGGLPSVLDRFRAQHSTCTFSKKALENRWSIIQRHIGKFVGCYARIERCLRSGNNEEDVDLSAERVYMEETGQCFAFKGCWEVLRDIPKFTTKISPNKRDAAEISDCKERPMGKKKSKYYKEQGNKEKQRLAAHKLLVKSAKKKGGTS